MPFRSCRLYWPQRRTIRRRIAAGILRAQGKEGPWAGKQLEGGFEAGQTVALVEDTTTTGGSTLDAVEIVEAAGGKVARVICLVDRGEGAVEAFAERGIMLEAIFNREDLPI